MTVKRPSGVARCDQRLPGCDQCIRDGRERGEGEALFADRARAAARRGRRRLLPLRHARDELYTIDLPGKMILSKRNGLREVIFSR